MFNTERVPLVGTLSLYKLVYENKNPICYDDIVYSINIILQSTEND
jgi:hypothetical protein